MRAGEQQQHRSAESLAPVRECARGGGAAARTRRRAPTPARGSVSATESAGSVRGGESREHVGSTEHPRESARAGSTHARYREHPRHREIPATVSAQKNTTYYVHIHTMSTPNTPRKTPGRTLI